MKKRLQSFSIVQAGYFTGALYGLVALLGSFIFILFGGAMALTGAGADSVGTVGSGLGLIGFGIGIPILYAVMGFIGGVITAAIYNVVARLTGGLVLTLEDA